jgi:hypothetical protein
MAKMTLLTIVQDVLNDINGDEVSSIDDTVEALQIAQIAKSTYLAMMSNRNWSHLRKSIILTPSSNTSKPTHMYIKAAVKEMCFINYDKRESTNVKSEYTKMLWKEPDDFLKLVNAYDETQDNVMQVVDENGMDLYIKTDEHPTYYTSFNDTTVVFNSYDSSRESHLQSTYIQAMAYVMPDWRSGDDSIPDLPDEAFSALVEEVKSRASLKLRQVQDVKSETESRRQQRWLSRKATRVSGGIKSPNYGRHK